MTLQSVPYDKLSAPTDINAREADGYKDINDLVASIRAKGLLQPLVVRASGNQFQVVAGRRRFLAIGQLIKDGGWPKGQPVPVMVRNETDEEALETSLIENIARKPMHPVQEYEVFARLNAAGADVDDIAGRYGITTAIVRQRLALGTLSAPILKAWRKGTINADTAQAFAAIRDKRKQAAAWKELNNDGHVTASRVRAFVVKDRPRLNDERLAFVGLDAYKAAGGTLVESLFENDGHLEDGELLNRLVDERIDSKCAELVADGWSFAIRSSEIKGNAIWSWEKLKPKMSYTREESDRVKELDAKLKELDQEDGYDYDKSQPLENERDAIQHAVTARGFSKAQKVQSGCVVEFDGDAPAIKYGMVKPAPDKRGKPGTSSASATDSGSDEPAVEEPGISQALLVDITALQTTAVAAVLAQTPELAIRVAAAALEPSRMSDSTASPVKLTCEGMTRYQQPYAQASDEDKEDNDEDPLIRNTFAAALSEITQKQAAARLAVNLGRALDLRQQKFNGPDEHAIAALVAALPGDIYLKAMREQFNPVDYFGRCSAKVIIAAMGDMHTDGVDPKAKKPALAELAAADAKAKGWLPVELRHPAYALFGQKKRSKAA